jgi:hypothetical protein
MSRKIINRPKHSYDSKINAISNYFGVSDSAAKYMYHLRRKSFPYKKSYQQDFLQWTLPLQNALVRADTYASFDWETLQFGEEFNTLMKHGIEFVDSNKVVRNDIQSNENNDGWTLVAKKDKLLIEKHILRNCGLLHNPNAKNKNDM